MAYDLRLFFLSVGQFAPSAPEDVAAERQDARDPVELIDETSAPITADPLPVGGFVDGIQASLVVVWREHRPVTLQFAAAGVVGPELVRADQALWVAVAAPDAAWAQGLDGGIPVHVLEADDPPTTEAVARQHLGHRRDELERALIDALVGTGTTTWVVDGGLRGRVRSERVVGVAKTVRTRYLPDERPLWNLPRGWRSARFTIGSGDATVYSCYLRLTDASRAGWTYGLVRLEARRLDQLEPLAARCLAEAQGPGSHDRRRDRHLGSVRTVEQYLQSLRPNVFG